MVLRVLLLACLLLPLGVVRGAEEPLQLMASIKPLALIAQEIVPGADVLLAGNSSPHEFALKVSDMQRLAAADLMVWVGPELEAFLVKPLAARRSSDVLTLSELAGITWPVDAEGHDHHGRDVHLWLNPTNAVVIARAIARRAGELRPAELQTYQARAERFAKKILALDAELSRLLAPVVDRGFAVYHDGYNHFVGHYGLRQIDYVALTPEQRPGARHIHHLEQALQDAACLFSEPYASDQATQALARRLGLRVGILDPLGGDLSVTDYTALLRSLATELSACLLGDQILP